MTGWLSVRDPGLNTTLQDFGRRGLQRLGVPVAGALDTVALRLANAVVGNRPETAGLEILLAGPRLEVEADSVRVALAGTGAVIEVLAGSESRTIPAWRSVILPRSTVFRIGALPETLCAYLAVEGGFEATKVLGSVSTYARGRLGGFEGRPIARGDRLPLVQGACERRGERALAAAPDPGRGEPIRIILGPQDDLFTPDAINLLLTSSFTISNNADRMGMRLEGPKLRHSGSADIVSDGTAPGSIQVPGSGQPIVLLSDRQTTGGYPKIATVISADLSTLARRRPGDRVEFEAVDMTSAVALREQHLRWLEAAGSGLVPVQDPATSLADSLLNENLISGVTAGAD